MDALLAVTLAATLTFPAALERALAHRAAATAYDARARLLEGVSVRTMPTVRAETSLSSAENLNLLNQNVGRVDAFVALVNVDYPLLQRGASERRRETLRTDAQLLRQEASAEADQVFEETLDAFSDLATADERVRLLGDPDQHVGALRTRAQTMLDRGLISNATAAQWEDQALAAEAQLVDLKVQRLEAETRLKQLLGDSSPELLQASLEMEAVPVHEVRSDDSVDRDPSVARASLLEQRSKLALEEALANQRPQLMLSGFGGVAAVPRSLRSDVSEGTFGVYGLRLSVSLPFLDAAASRRLAEARIEAENATRTRTLAATAARNRAGLLRIAENAGDQRITLLTSAVEIARSRYESMARLVAAGVRTDGDLAAAAAEVSRRESDLVAVRIERWKLQQRAMWRR
jgi:outer membrane protein TolC